MKSFLQSIEDICDNIELIEWVEKEKISSLLEFWEKCPRASWRLWLCEGNIDNHGWPTRNEMNRITAWCALRVVHMWNAPDGVKENLRKILETGELQGTLAGGIFFEATDDLNAIQAAMFALDGTVWATCCMVESAILKIGDTEYQQKALVEHVRRSLKPGSSVIPATKGGQK